MRFNKKPGPRRAEEPRTKGTPEVSGFRPATAYSGSTLRARLFTVEQTTRGFSLVEIMIVVVIIGLMAGLVVYATSGYLDRAKRQRARADIATLAGAVDSFYLAKGEYPPGDQGLKALTPEFVKVVQIDPWGNPYQYLIPGKGGPYDIVSYGADGREGGTGADADITNWDVEVREAKRK